MIITATQRQISVTPRKMRKMATAIKNLKPQEAVNQLEYLNYSAAKPLSKVIKQAIANATNNHKINPDSLKIKEIVVNQGWTLKRWHAGARGRGKPYTRRRSHVTIKLEDTSVSTPNTSSSKKASTINPEISKTSKKLDSKLSDTSKKTLKKKPTTKSSPKKSLKQSTNNKNK